MVQHYTDMMIVVLFSLWLIAQCVVAFSVGKASEAQPGKGNQATVAPASRAIYFAWWKWASVIVEVSGAGMAAAVVIHLLLCTNFDMHFFNNHIFIQAQ